MLLDLHNHTRYSPDSRVDPAALVELARKIRLAGIAITDHNSVGGIAAAQQAAGPDFPGIPPVEVSPKIGHGAGDGDREIVPGELFLRVASKTVVPSCCLPRRCPPVLFRVGSRP